jgi:hypothetical protein
MMKSTLATILIWIVLCIAIVPHASAFAITAQDITESSITWNVTSIGSPEIVISSVSFDGVNLTERDPGATLFIQSGLKPDEWHSIRVETSDTLSKTALAKTNVSALDRSTTSSNNEILQLADFFNTWIYLILIVIFVAAGLIRRLGFLEVVASIISLYALVKYVSENDLSVTDIWHVNFILYIFFFIFPYIIVYFKGGFTK